MRSITFTLFLALLAAAILGVLGWQARDGNLNAIFGVPPTPLGQRLYTDFQPSEVSKITIHSHNSVAEFVKTDDGWQSLAEPKDRMDPRYALAIIAFTLNLNVVDYAEADRLDREEIGLRDGSVQVTLSTSRGDQLAQFKMGDRTPIQAENKESTTADPTVFIQPRERSRRDYIYACTGDIGPLFTEGFKFLRDHRPLYFSPQFIQKIRLRGAEGELTIGHEDPKGPWRIVKPLDLRTDAAAVKSLIESLYELKAVKVANRSEVTLPGAEVAGKTLQIGLTQFGSEKEVLLEVYPPETPDAREALATVSDRPNTVFYLPLKPEPGFEKTLANLPVTVDELRDRAITNLNIASLRAISINPATGKKILVTINPPQRWMVEIDGKVQRANEERLAALLKALTTGRAIAFETDAATDFKPWGLDRPLLTIELLGENHEGIKLNFGIDGRGGLFANRQGTPTVMRIDPGFLSSVSIQPFEWRYQLLWSLSMVDLFAIERTVRGETPLYLFYDFKREEFKGEIDNQNVTDRIDQVKTSRWLENLVALNVTRWLAGDDEKAIAALADPLLTLNVSEKTVNEFGDTVGIEGKEISLAPPAGDTNPQILYGQLKGDPNFFILERDAFSKIATDPLEK